MSDRRIADITDSPARRKAGAASAARALRGELDDHPSYEMLAAVVDETAGDVTVEIVESHAVACEVCAAELADLRAFAARPDRRIRKSIWWSAAAAAVLAIVLLFATKPVAERPSSRRAATPYGRADWNQLVADALRTGRLDIPPDLRGLAAPDAFRSPTQNGAPRVTVTPAATVIDDTRPRFTWTGVTAEEYQVRVSVDGQEVARSPRQRETSWLCSRDLDRGKTYRWQVDARRGGESFIVPQPPAPPAIFRVLGPAEHDELLLAARQHPGDDLLLGVLCGRAGVLDRARDHLARYASSTRSPAAMKLLASLDADR